MASSVKVRQFGATNNAVMVDIGPVRLYFSYETIVAFHEDGHTQKVSQNYWSQTTGKHLNWIDDGDKKNRLTRDEFEAELSAMLKRNGLES